jgi:hypothetical protein
LKGKISLQRKRETGDWRSVWRDEIDRKEGKKRQIRQTRREDSKKTPRERTKQSETSHHPSFATPFFGENDLTIALSSSYRISCVGLIPLSRVTEWVMSTIQAATHGCQKCLIQNTQVTLILEFEFKGSFFAIRGVGKTTKFAVCSLLSCLTGRSRQNCETTWIPNQWLHN